MPDRRSAWGPVASLGFTALIWLLFNLLTLGMAFTFIHYGWGDGRVRPETLGNNGLFLAVSTIFNAVVCSLERFENPLTVEIPTYSGKIKEFVRYGKLHFEIGGKAQSLVLYQNVKLSRKPAFRDLFFIPFKDLTNGEETYGGGRYIDFWRSSLQAEPLILDFNMAYNPWCYYSDGYNCPIPPPENHLDVSIAAGEMLFAADQSE